MATIPPPTVPLVDPKTGIVSVPWYQYLLALQRVASKVYFGFGDPTTNALSASKGSIYLRLDGSGVANRAYINTDGMTAWTNLVTAT